MDLEALANEEESYWWASISNREGDFGGINTRNKG